MADLKSLAHPDWPYTDSPWEWRGFAEKAMPKVQPLYQPDYPEAIVAWVDGKPRYLVREDSIYQKQNFGPELK